MLLCSLYAIILAIGYVFLLTGGIWLGRMMSERMMDDPFNDENESFMQETRLIKNEYSVNLPTRFYYNKQWHNGFANVVNPARAVAVIGSPGSGKSYCVINQFIKQQIEKGFAMYVYELNSMIYRSLYTTTCANISTVTKHPRSSMSSTSIIRGNHTDAIQ